MGGPDPANQWTLEADVTLRKGLALSAVFLVEVALIVFLVAVAVSKNTGHSVIQSLREAFLPR
jgi:hypothetical protein